MTCQPRNAAPRTRSLCVEKRRRERRIRGNFERTRTKSRCGGIVRFKRELKSREFSWSYNLNERNSSSSGLPVSRSLCDSWLGRRNQRFLEFSSVLPTYWECQPPLNIFPWCSRFDRAFKFARVLRRILVVHKNIPPQWNPMQRRIWHFYYHNWLQLCRNDPTKLWLLRFCYR